MKLTAVTAAAVLVCLFSLIARSYAMRAAARQERAYAEQERLALAAIDSHLRANLPKLTRR
ncbi:MAG: hypothetical protein ABR567_00545 [Myxococcales bacterium]|nr:hypothetical protein [Myxococcales bacterium]